jgi:uncharacterized protein (DUF608 family)
MDTSHNNKPCCPGGACGGIDRRDFLALSGIGLIDAVGFKARQDAAAAGTAPDHYVPADKHLTPERVRALFARGERKVFRGNELRTIGMPCGGVAAGQLYVRGDGTLAYWWIANNAHNSAVFWTIPTDLGDYPAGYSTFRPPSPIAQGFAVRAVPATGTAQVAVRQLALSDFDQTGFIGEYPVATILYESGEPFPVEVTGQVFSPYIPLNSRDSAMPLTYLRYTIKNTRHVPMKVTLAGWLQNPVLQDVRATMHAMSRNRAVTAGGRASVLMDAIAPQRAPEPEPVVEMFDDFEHGYGNWKIEGDAFGTEPAGGTLPGQQEVAGFHGKGLVNTFRNGDGTTGRAVSKTFVVRFAYITFLIGGGADRERTALRLIVNGKVARSATGKNNEHLEPGFWEVSEFMGREAHFEILDAATGGWGHINVDDIAFSTLPPRTEDAAFAETHPLNGNVALTAMEPGSRALTNVGSVQHLLDRLRSNAPADAGTASSVPLQTPLIGAVESEMLLKPGESHTFTFALSWFFPNRRQDPGGADGPDGRVSAVGPVVGQMYANWFRSALDVANYGAEHQGRLVKETLTFRDTYYDTTLPYWLAQRLSMPLANMATEVFQWWRNGRVWAWEGVGCCNGCCGHVYNYAQAMARLFPDMERTIREDQDFDPTRGFVEATGAIGFRGMPGGFWAGDAQGGYLLKAYREHLCSKDDAFLRRNWPQIKKALQFLLHEDGDDDGLIEGAQHNTYDIWFYGPNTMVGSLYLGALKAGAQMARRMDEAAFAARCDRVAREGADHTMQKLWNGEYFVQAVDLHQHPKDQYADGCLSDQLLGQWFAHQLDLGYLYSPDAVQKAMASIFKYNWAPDVGPQNRAHHPGRTFCATGEAGLLVCTWPHSHHLGDSAVLYRDEVWTGIEYQVAAHLLYEGKPTEALSIVRGIHDRYDGTHHNPWNEIECGDHYGRALASWSVLLAASGFLHDGPAARIGFLPNITPDAFRAFFCASEGWGAFEQKRANGTQHNVIALKWGRLRARELVFAAEHGATVAVTLDGKPVAIEAVQRTGTRTTTRLAHETIVEAGQGLHITLA